MKLQDPSLYDPIQTSFPPIAAEGQGKVLGITDEEANGRKQNDETKKVNVPSEVSPISLY